jgi:uncharacterized repeat protein (TIGR01451 family)
MKLRSIFLLGVAALAGGCATPNVERIATVQSRAEALYAYGGVATFPVSSELVEVSVYAPVHHQREYPIEREKVKPVINKRPTQPAISEQPAKPPVAEQATAPASSKAAASEQSTPPAASQTTSKPAVSEPSHSADSDTQKQAAPVRAQQSAAQAEGTHLESVEPAQKETVAAIQQPPAEVEKPQAADIRQQTSAADTRVSEHQPTLHKKIRRDHVGVAEKFQFTIEFQNTTPVDLASVQLTDPIDPRLKLFPDQITVKPNYEHHVSVGNGQVVVRFAKEIKRGKRVRVTIPVMFPVTSAAAAQ